MKPPKVLEQSIAVFGESGSGKTVLLSSFYGAMQEAEFDRTSLYNVTADDVSQGIRLHKNYLGMRNADKRPPTNKFRASRYAFSARFKGDSRKRASVDALRLVWHDYPGDWFEETPVNAEEGRRRVETFKQLLGADVALVLVDGQRLVEESGQEEKYLKLLMTNLRNGLLSLKDGLLADEGRLTNFPRIWVMALSKADLLPHMDVYDFRDLLIEKAGDDLDALRRAVGELVEADEALALGADFVLLSSAKFDAERIRVLDRVGVDLIHPMAAVLPLETHARWASLKALPAKVGDALLENVDGLAGLLVGRRVPLPLPGPAGVLAGLLGPRIAKAAADLAGGKLKQVHATALEKQEYAAATLAAFKLALEDAERAKVLLRGLE
ncbi:TRAFAC clade GTPase domain-containing protein [uncultured Pseudokineococcus sp.]|uniref:TRAFAC clade GTPase domain-containing protein n=1 Tax=uncultured Pseudokineococcus sp. TaxID=1642928 RepID=UPI00260408DA|nr:hypothetical protein [uncultured Pseudokineococcus sp.]